MESLNESDDWKGSWFKMEQTAASPITNGNKKEVKTTTFSPPGVGGVLHANPLAAQQACPARQVCGLTRGLPFAIR